MESLLRYYLPVKAWRQWEPASALGRNNTDKVSQEIQYQTAALFTTYSGGGASVSFINWWAGSFELPAQAKLAVVLILLLCHSTLKMNFGATSHNELEGAGQIHSYVCGKQIFFHRQ